MKIKYPIADVISILKKNREAHVIELKDAMGAWTDQVLTALRDLTDAVSRKGIEASFETLQRLFYSKPKDVRYQYAKYIGMMERAVGAGETVVEIDDDEYDRLFNDNWEWSVTAKATNSTYTRSRG